MIKVQWHMKKNASEKLLEITRCKTVKENICFEDILAVVVQT
ncbi:Uncharacterised protein [Legionella israelensis]|nr:hypothetical protein SAMN02746069_02683 [Legionella israelensis DSM 19235]STX58759.1 Uncharacterised protein [Legionella israelensis]